MKFSKEVLDKNRLTYQTLYYSSSQLPIQTLLEDLKHHKNLGWEYGFFTVQKIIPETDEQVKERLVSEFQDYKRLKAKFEN